MGKFASFLYRYQQIHGKSKEPRPGVFLFLPFMPERQEPLGHIPNFFLPQIKEPFKQKNHFHGL